MATGAEGGPRVLAGLRREVGRGAGGRGLAVAPGRKAWPPAARIPPFWGQWEAAALLGIWRGFGKRQEIKGLGLNCAAGCGPTKTSEDGALCAQLRIVSSVGARFRCSMARIWPFR